MRGVRLDMDQIPNCTGPSIVRPYDRCHAVPPLPSPPPAPHRMGDAVGMGVGIADRHGQRVPASATRAWGTRISRRRMVVRPNGGCPPDRRCMASMVTTTAMPSTTAARRHGGRRARPAASSSAMTSPRPWRRARRPRPISPARLRWPASTGTRRCLTATGTMRRSAG